MPEVRVFIAKCESAPTISGTIFQFTTHFEEVDMKVTTADSEGNILGTFDADDLLTQGTGMTAEERKAELDRRIDALRERYAQPEEDLRAKLVEANETIERLRFELAELQAKEVQTK